MHVFSTGLLARINDNAKPVERQGRKTAGFYKIDLLPSEAAIFCGLGEKRGIVENDKTNIEKSTSGTGCFCM